LPIIRDAVEAELVNDVDYLTDIYENQPEMVTSVCVRHILTATIEEAQAVKARLEAGEDFATVAAEVSLDTNSPGGALPCPSPAGAFVPGFATVAATAEIGQVADPVETQFGWHVIVVDERSAPDSLEDLLRDPMAFVHPTLLSNVWEQWTNAAVGDVDVDVASKIGTWAPASHGILPPSSG